MSIYNTLILTNLVDKGILLWYYYVSEAVLGRYRKVVAKSTV